MCGNQNAPQTFVKRCSGVRVDARMLLGIGAPFVGKFTPESGAVSD
jgi:hypothetical protein